jgi:hypothetical protein
MKRIVSRFEGSAIRKGALPVFAALCLATALFSACDLGMGGQTLPPAAPVIQAVTIKSNNTQTEMTGQEGTITVTWGAVAGAETYELYYAPQDPEVPSIPADPATTVTTTSAAITAADIGNNTMNYYVWVKAANTAGTSASSKPASTLDRFIGMWSPINYGGDSFCISNADVAYDTGWENFSVYGYIRAIVPFNNNESVNFNNHNGPAGVIIVEYDGGHMDSSEWSWAGPPNYFNAVYYYGLNGSGEEATAYLGIAADLAGTYGQEDYGCEVNDVDEAIKKFTLGDKDSYISAEAAAEYKWSE